MLKGRGAVAVVALVVGLAVGWLTGRASGQAVWPAGPAASSAGPAWIRGGVDERFAQLEKHLRGLDVAMAEIGYRYTELSFAVQDRNWDYADYQLGKIQLALELAVERRPKRAKSAGVFLKDDLPVVQSGIKSRDRVSATEAMARLRSACMKCHVSEEVPHFTLREPDHRLTSIRPE
jgi:hypothetical protein